MKIDLKYNECIFLLNDHLATLTRLEAWYEILALVKDNAHHTWADSLMNAINNKLVQWSVEDRMIAILSIHPHIVYKIIRYIKCYRFPRINFRKFSEITKYQHIKRLDILFCDEAVNFKEFIHSPYTTGLEQLSIHASGIPLDEMIELCESPIVKQLNSQKISGELHGYYEYLESLSNQNLCNLKNLSFQNLGMRPPDIENYLSCLSGPNLENLDLRGSYGLNTANVIKLLNYDNFIQLKKLNLRRTMITQRHLEVINRQTNHNVNIEVS